MQPARVQSPTDEPAASPRRPRPVSRRVVFVLFMLVGVAGFVEAVSALAWFLVVPESRRAVVETALELRNPGFNSVLRYRPHPYLNYIGNPDYLAPDGTKLHHPLGFRATDVDLRHKAPGTFRIVALGESTTFGFYIANRYNVWPELVGLALRETLEAPIEVLNAGVPNYTTFEMLGLATLWLPEFDADLVLVHTGMNDAFAVGFPDEGGPDNATFRHSWTYRPLPRAGRAAMRASHFARLLGAGWLERAGYAVDDMGRAMQYPVPPLDEVRKNVASATGRYFRRNVETLIALIRQAGAEPVLVDMPLNPTFEQLEDVYYDAVSQAVLRNNRILAEVALARGVTLVDLHSRLRDPGLFKDAAHVGEQGMMQKAQGVFEAILPLVRERLPRQ